jgi:serine/threonine protein kinase
LEELRPGDPTQLGSFRLLNRIGSGGMGEVFLGQSPGGRPVAIKVIRPELANDPGFRARFANEVASARAVHGFFTALVVDADPDAVAPWLATAYVPGPSLANAVEESGPLPTESVRTLAAGLAEGLAAIHEAGLVHRDLKPSNVLLAQDGPRVIDFGISRAAEGASLTASGVLVGTPAFMSPEQVEGGSVGPASDIFSLGAVLAYAASGEGPFGTGNRFALLYRVVNNSPDTSNVPAEIRPLIDRCLAKDSSDRPEARSLLTELGTVRPAINWLPQPITRMLERYDALDQGDADVWDSEAAKAVFSGRAARRRARVGSKGPSQGGAVARLHELEDASQRRLEARELYRDLEQVDTASQLAKQLHDLSRQVGRQSAQPPTLPATAKPADIEAVAAGRLIPDQDLLDMFLIASGVHPEHLEPWHEALDRVTAATLIIEYRVRAAGHPAKSFSLVMRGS